MINVTNSLEIAILNGGQFCEMVSESCGISNNTNMLAANHSRCEIEPKVTVSELRPAG